MDFRFISGVGIVVPFTVNQVLQSKVTLRGFRLQEKSEHFYNIGFNNIRYVGVAAIDNTITLSRSKPDLKMNFSGYYSSPLLQGIYKLGSVYDISADLKWTLPGDKISVLIKYDNIFQSHMPKSIVIDQSNQYSRLNKYDDSRCFSIALVWKFGGFKAKSYERVDDSRFGK